MAAWPAGASRSHGGASASRSTPVLPTENVQALEPVAAAPPAQRQRPGRQRPGGSLAVQGVVSSWQRPSSAQLSNRQAVAVPEAGLERRSESAAQEYQVVAPAIPSAARGSGARSASPSLVGSSWWTARQHLSAEPTEQAAGHRGAAWSPVSSPPAQRRREVEVSFAADCACAPVLSPPRGRQRSPTLLAAAPESPLSLLAVIRRPREDALDESSWMLTNSPQRQLVGSPALGDFTTGSSSAILPVSTHFEDSRQSCGSPNRAARSRTPSPLLAMPPEDPADVLAYIGHPREQAAPASLAVVAEGSHEESEAEGSQKAAERFVDQVASTTALVAPLPALAEHGEQHFEEDSRSRSSMVSMVVSTHMQALALATSAESSPRQALSARSGGSATSVVRESAVSGLATLGEVGSFSPRSWAWMQAHAGFGSAAASRADAAESQPEVMDTDDGTAELSTSQATHDLPSAPLSARSVRSQQALRPQSPEARYAPATASASQLPSYPQLARREDRSPRSSEAPVATSVTRRAGHYSAATGLSRPIAASGPATASQQLAMQLRRSKTQSTSPLGSRAASRSSSRRGSLGSGRGVSQERPTREVRSPPWGDTQEVVVAGVATATAAEPAAEPACSSYSPLGDSGIQPGAATPPPAAKDVAAALTKRWAQSLPLLLVCTRYGDTAELPLLFTRAIAACLAPQAVRTGTSSDGSSSWMLAEAVWKSTARLALLRLFTAWSRSSKRQKLPPGHSRTPVGARELAAARQQMKAFVAWRASSLSPRPPEPASASFVSANDSSILDSSILSVVEPSLARAAAAYGPGRRKARTAELVAGAEMEAWERAISLAAQAEMTMADVAERGEAEDEIQRLEFMLQASQNELRARAEACVELSEAFLQLENQSAEQVAAVGQAASAQLSQAEGSLESLVFEVQSLRSEVQAHAEARYSSEQLAATLEQSLQEAVHHVAAAAADASQARSGQQAERHRFQRLAVLRACLQAWFRWHRIVAAECANNKEAAQKYFAAWWRLGKEARWRRDLETLHALAAAEAQEARDAQARSSALESAALAARQALEAEVQEASLAEAAAARRAGELSDTAAEKQLLSRQLQEEAAAAAEAAGVQKELELRVASSQTLLDSVKASADRELDGLRDECEQAKRFALDLEQQSLRQVQDVKTAESSAASLSAAQAQEEYQARLSRQQTEHELQLRVLEEKLQDVRTAESSAASLSAAQAQEEYQARLSRQQTEHELQLRALEEKMQASATEHRAGRQHSVAEVLELQDELQTAQAEYEEEVLMMQRIYDQSRRLDERREALGASFSEGDEETLQQTLQELHEEALRVLREQHEVETRLVDERWASYLQASQDACREELACAQKEWRERHEGQRGEIASLREMFEAAQDARKAELDSIQQEWRKEEEERHKREASALRGDLEAQEEELALSRRQWTEQHERQRGEETELRRKLEASEVAYGEELASEQEQYRESLEQHNNDRAALHQELEACQSELEAAKEQLQRQVAELEEGQRREGETQACQAQLEAAKEQLQRQLAELEEGQRREGENTAAAAAGGA
eukprot:TRINITY_DN7517_c0_g1_i3.p1 TRINITY_DN7517_c0_g1~~TRINITY_DN7517_c0_g1_i3.p1  ORF type:complete len:1565 (-),score=456.59 TRINITY_DN7517_c0_g1_i3:3832-8526(-)